MTAYIERRTVNVPEEVSLSVSAEPSRMVRYLRALADVIESMEEEPGLSGTGQPGLEGTDEFGEERLRRYRQLQRGVTGRAWEVLVEMARNSLQGGGAASSLAIRESLGLSHNALAGILNSPTRFASRPNGFSPYTREGAYGETLYWMSQAVAEGILAVAEGSPSETP
jgi:hypothetical protein